MPLRGERRAFTRAVLAEAPEAPGVYALFKDHQVLLYGSAFGGTITIRSCLMDRFTALGDEATHCGWEVSLDPAGREQVLLEELRSKHENGKAD
jgi:hypothetical protein